MQPLRELFPHESECSPRPQRQVADSVAISGLDRQHLTQPDPTGLEGEPSPRHVQAPHFGAVQPDLGDRFVPVLDEIGAPVAPCHGVQRHTSGSDAAVGRVAHHAAPTAPDIQQPVAWPQAEHLEHQTVLVLLRLVHRRVGVPIARAGVRHRRPRHPLVKGTRYVVVVVDDVLVPGLAVPESPDTAAPP